MLPAFTDGGDLPPGVYVSDWQEFQTRFCGSSLRRVWLASRLQEILKLAGTSGKLRRVFVWGSFVTAKVAPKDIDLLLIMAEDFDVSELAVSAQAIFNAPRAKLMFSADVFWARASIGQELLSLWLDTHQVSRTFQKTRYLGIEAAMIQTGEQMLVAQQCVSNLRTILLKARKVHSPQDYTCMAEPILLEIQQREQEILEYLVEVRVAQ